MEGTTDILNYVIQWRSKSPSGFIGELFFVVKNKSGGSLSTPVGHLFGFVEPASEYSTSFWKLLLTIREEIRYDEARNATHVFVESAYANKAEYYLIKAQELIGEIVRIDPQLTTALHGTLTKTGLCNYPLEIKIICGEEKPVYSDVVFSFD